MHSPVHILITRGAIGNAYIRVSSTSGDERLFYWNGPGARLMLVLASVHYTIEHPSADGNYATLRDARDAARRFCVDR